MSCFASAVFIVMVFGINGIESICPPNEQEVECINFCNTCEVDKVCLGMCFSGCDCKPGFLRNKLGRCIPRHLCQQHEEQNLSCPPDEHFVPCSAHCQKNCSNHDKPSICPFVCVPGCVCNSGFVRGNDNKCIKKEGCHAEERNTSVAASASCPVDEEISTCHAHCQRNCSNYKDAVLPCPKICVFGCVCKKGMVRGPENRCILPQKCSMERSYEAGALNIDHWGCPSKERFDPCIAHCQQKCSDWMVPLPCTRMCVPGCICKEGLVRGPHKKCIHPREC